jgi:hypothetical protein
MKEVYIRRIFSIEVHCRKNTMQMNGGMAFVARSVEEVEKQISAFNSTHGAECG